MIKKIISAFTVLAVLVSGQGEALAWRLGRAGAQGRAVINVGGNDVIPANFINVWPLADQEPTTNTDITKLDADGYLTSAPAGNMGRGWPAAGTMWTNTTYKMVWTAGIQFKFTFNSNMSNCANTSNVTITGCAGGGATITATTTTGGSFTFDTDTTQFSGFFPNSGTYSRSGSGTIALYRLSDDTDYNAGQILTSEYITALSYLRANAVRPMGWVQSGAGNFNGETTFTYRSKLTDAAYQIAFPPALQVGGGSAAISGTNTYTASAAPSTPGSWTDGEQFIGIVANANTSSTVTFNIAGRGAKTAVSNANYTPAVGGIGAGIVVGTYDAILDKVLLSCGSPGFGAGTASGCNGGLIRSSAPLEAQVQIANRLNANLWGTVPPWATDAYVNSWGAYIRDNLTSTLQLWPEYSNEITFNYAFPQTPWADGRGAALGFSGGRLSWTSLRNREINGNLLPTVFSGQTSRLQGVVAYQAAGDSSIITYLLNSTELAPSGTSTGTGNALYTSYTGGANYTAAGQRTVDKNYITAIAPYAGGANLCTGPDTNCTVTSAMAAWYQALVTAWEAGQSATAIAMVDADINTGRISVQNVTASGTTFTTPLAHGFSVGDYISYQVTGGTIYSNITQYKVYKVSATPSSTTFRIQGFTGGFPAGADVNAGSAGSGTMTVGLSNSPNMIFLGTTWYQFAESNAALYDSYRSGAGLPNLLVKQYEGNLEPAGLSAAQCTSLSITGSNCAASIAAAITAWKSDTSAKATQKAYFNQFMGTVATFAPTYGLMAHSSAPAQLVFPQAGTDSCTGGVWPLLSGCLPTSTLFQLGEGFREFNLQ